MVAQLKDYGWRWEQENKAAFKANEERKDLLQELQEARNQLLMIKDKSENGFINGSLNQLNNPTSSSTIGNNKKQIETPRLNQTKQSNNNNNSNNNYNNSSTANENKKYIRKIYLPKIYNKKINNNNNNGSQPSPKSETSITSDVYENSLI